MSNDQMRKPGRAPGRFLATKTILETPKPVAPVANTPIKRFDRKDAMDRDLERYRAEARARLLRNGFDVPAYLMPKPPAAEDEDEDDETPALDPDELRDIKSKVMSGPKPSPLAKVSNTPIAKSQTAPVAKPSRHVHVQAGVAQKLHQAAPAAPAQNGGQVSPDEGDGDEHSAYQDYVDSLNGGPTLLDHMRSDEAPITGRVDALKTAKATKSRIDLPDNSANWVSRGGDNKPFAARSGSSKSTSRAKRSKGKSVKGQEFNWNNILPKFAAYMIAAVCIGYVLVLTLNQFTAVLHK